MSIKYFLALCLSLSLIIISCSPEDMEPAEKDIADDFEIPGKWNFIRVAGDATIIGIPQSDVDDTPDGYVEFLNDNTGFASFDVTLLGQDFIEEQDFIWEQPALDSLILYKSDGKVDHWTLIKANNQAVEAEWLIEIAGNKGTITSHFEK